MRGCTHATPITQQADSAAHHTPPSNLGNIDPPTAFHWPTIPFSASDSTILEAKFNDTNSTLWADAGRQEKTNTHRPSSRITPSAAPSVPTLSPIPPTLPTTSSGHLAARCRFSQARPETYKDGDRPALLPPRSCRAARGAAAEREEGSPPRPSDRTPAPDNPLPLQPRRTRTRRLRLL
ncbi:hypothetical protein CSOJ01_07893 [Colletotrichum sojae]|uniref:Uncharacterized protein n=1 Tax=Colletotrichum sojae TaxID=2175907 RepID=A0A8H6J7R3_9PEZI|nr:hypothetical protein CSOJ01_07893 [Colletotrichum sojae]